MTFGATIEARSRDLGFDRFGPADRFVRRCVVTSAVGIACLSPYLAWRQSTDASDVVLALGLATPLAAAWIASRFGRLDLARAVSTAGAGCLVACALMSGGLAAWPVLILLLADPIRASACEGARGARPAIIVAAAIAAVLIGWSLALGFGANQTASGPVALTFLICGILADLPLHAFAVAPPKASAPEAARAYCAAGDLVTWHNREGDVLKANGAAFELSGRSPPALVGGGLFGQVHVPDRPAYLKALSDAANGTQPVAAEIRLLADDGAEAGFGRGSARLVWVEMRVQAAGPAPAVPGSAAIAFIRDASGVHRHAEELEAARLEAVRASDMKGRFLATVSHELRTPLNAIIGFSELLSADHPYVLEEARRKEYATIIRESGHHLLEVVNTLLDMSKIESGNFDLEAEPFNLADLVNGCVDLMRLKAEGAGISLLRKVEPELPEITGDRRACRQIVINLLSNAVKFTPAGGRVTIAIAREEDRMILSVADSGIGIRETDLPRLGDPFFQAGDDPHRRSHEGTGLGLSVVRGLVGLHRGTMAIESGPGAGTTVTISLPLDCGHDGGEGRPVPVRVLARRPAPASERKSA